MNRFAFFVIILFISSCTVYKEYPIDVYKPGEIAVPPNVEDISIIYRNFKFPGDTLQHYLKDDHRLRRIKNDPDNLDSLLASYCLKELAKNLESRNIYDQIKIYPSAFKPHSGKRLPTLSFDLVDKITSSSNTDLLISLETFSYFFSKYSTQYDTPESNEVITAAIWAVYDPVKDKLLERKTMIDTVFWNGYDTKGNYVKGTKLPPRKTALKIASQLAGENYSKRFFASWQTVNRMYSIPPLPDFSQAATYVDEGKWDEAIKIWERYAPEKNGKMAINARYNLALAYEMKDNIELAWEWLMAAQQLATSYKSKEDIKMILQYQKILNNRKKDIDRLNQN